jgi:nicotinamide-nucleotide amidase
LKKHQFLRAVLLTIGDELLVGDTINSNAAWLGNLLTRNGLRLKAALTVPDDAEAIKAALSQYLVPGTLVISTGGLGPTHDDITKKTVLEYFKVGLKRDEVSLKRNQAYFESRGIPFSVSNFGQSDVPENADVLQNLSGTAQGMWIEHDGAVLVILPGVPREMKHLMELQVMPRIAAERRIETATSVHYLKTMGIGESTLSDIVLPEAGSFLNGQVSLAFLPQSLGVNLRIIGTGKNEADAADKAGPLLSYIRDKAAPFIYSEVLDETPAAALGRFLVSSGLTLGFAESCTGGLFAAQHTDIPGSSRWFKGSVVAYSNEVKTNVLGVSAHTISQFGAVSREVALEMVLGAKKVLRTDICISATGIAGPDGGTAEKPVGLVWIGIAGPFGTGVFKAVFGRDRTTNRERSVFLAQEVVRRLLLGVESMPTGVVLERVT